MKHSLSPFLRWAGGKRWLTFSKSFNFPKTFNRYIEPFLGSGAVFFFLKPEQAILSDLNEELIVTYNAIKDDWRSVKTLLQEHHINHSKEHYYLVRGIEQYSLNERAARFIYLNRTCWNGLYRVNLKGTFNVPIGTKTKVIFEDDNFESISDALTKCHISARDFEEVINEAQRDDFLFVDPPYTVKHNYNNFIKYNERIFSWNDQIRLRNCLLEAKERGVKLVATNAFHASVIDLYKDFNCRPISRNSIIAAKSSHRCTTQELLIIA